MIGWYVLRYCATSRLKAKALQTPSRESKIPWLDAFVARDEITQYAAVDRFGQETHAAVAEECVGPGGMKAEDFIVGTAVVGAPGAIGRSVHRRLVAVDERLNAARNGVSLSGNAVA